MRNAERRIYFLRPATGHGPIKIGCSRWPENRLHQYTKWSPEPLCIVGTVPGDHRLEGRIHRYLEAHALHHEWFAPDPFVVETMTRILDGSFDYSLLPEKGRAYPRAVSA